MITNSVMAMAKKIVNDNPNLMVIAQGYNNQNAPKLFATTLDKPTRTFVNLLPDHECCELMLSGWVVNIQTACEPICAIITAVYGDCEQMLRDAYDNPSLTPEKKLAIRANPQQVLYTQACAALKVRVLEEVIRRLHE